MNWSRLGSDETPGARSPFIGWNQASGDLPARPDEGVQGRLDLAGRLHVRARERERVVRRELLEAERDLVPGTDVLRDEPVPAVTGLAEPVARAAVPVADGRAAPDVLTLERRASHRDEIEVELRVRAQAVAVVLGVIRRHVVHRLAVPARHAAGEDPEVDPDAADDVLALIVVEPALLRVDAVAVEEADLEVHRPVRSLEGDAQVVLAAEVGARDRRALEEIEVGRRAHPHLVAEREELEPGVDREPHRRQPRQLQGGVHLLRGDGGRRHVDLEHVDRPVRVVGRLEAAAPDEEALLRRRGSRGWC